jgi:DNA polymerase-3 subunit gamma/tau
VAASSTSITADVWELTVRPGLRGMARAIYAPAAFVASTPTTLTLSVPNAAHRAKCEQHRAAVEAALREFAGTAVRIELVDGGGGPDGGERESAPAVREAPAAPATGAPATGARSSGTMSTAAESEPEPTMTSVAPNVASWLPDDDDVDLDDLTDAPPESVKSPIERLAEAFPGSQLIEEAG